MPRIARPVFAGTPHHITQRGNRREDVFFDEADRVAYLAWLGEYCAKYKVKVLAYCLMTNHVHVVAVPGSDQALERVFRPFCTPDTRSASIVQRDGRNICSQYINNNDSYLSFLQAQ